MVSRCPKIPERHLSEFQGPPFKTTSNIFQLYQHSALKFHSFSTPQFSLSVRCPTFASDSHRVAHRGALSFESKGSKPKRVFCRQSHHSWYLLLFCTALFQLLSYCHMIFDKKWWTMIWTSLFEHSASFCSWFPSAWSQAKADYTSVQH